MPLMRAFGSFVLLGLATITLAPEPVHAIVRRPPSNATLEVEATTSRPDVDLPMELVTRMAQTRLSAFLQCYDHIDRARPSTLGSGEIVLELLVAAHGRSTTATVSTNTLADADVAECARRVASSFRFDPGPSAPAPSSLHLRYRRVAPRSNAPGGQ